MKDLFSEWDKFDNESSEANAKALYFIFNGVSLNEFKRIVTCKYTNETWDILIVTHEGNYTMKLSKLWMLSFQFERIRMNEDETFFQFYTNMSDIGFFFFLIGNLSDIVNCFNLREKIPNSKVLRKILWSSSNLSLRNSSLK